MSSADVVELSVDDMIGKSRGKKSKRRLDSALGAIDLEWNTKTKSKKVRRKSKMRQEPEENIVSVARSTIQNDSSALDQEPSPVDESSPSSIPAFGPAPICRQFWKAGNYDMGEGSKTQHQSMQQFSFTYY